MKHTPEEIAKWRAKVIEEKEARNFEVRFKIMIELCDRWERELDQRIRRSTPGPDGKLRGWNKAFPEQPVDPLWINIDQNEISRFRQLCTERKDAGDREFFKALSFLQQQLNYGWDEHSAPMERSWLAEHDRKKSLPHARKKAADTNSIKGKETRRKLRDAFTRRKLRRQSVSKKDIAAELGMNARYVGELMKQMKLV